MQYIDSAPHKNREKRMAHVLNPHKAFIFRKRMELFTGFDAALPIR
jgi:hypothetical protein